MRFRVHKAKLSAASSVFDGMLEVGSGCSVTLVEPASVLERILPFVYPQVVQPVKTKFPEGDSFVEALFKYEVCSQLSPGRGQLADTLISM